MSSSFSFSTFPVSIARLPLARTGTRMFLSAGVLVSLPVFAQAPLVRYAPWVSLVLTLGWLGLSLHLMSLRPYRNWGSLLYGFTLTWLAGSLYWGWLRTEPLWHMPIESIALPFVLWGLARGFARIGNYFFLGSLFGTAITDLYIHTMKLLPFWRQALQPDVSEGEAMRLLEGALEQMQTGVGIAAAIVLSAILWTVGKMGLQFARDRRQGEQLHWWAFSGAVLFTLLVDGLFALGVCLGSSQV